MGAKNWMRATPRALTPAVTPNPRGPPQPRRRRRKRAQNFGCVLNAIFGGIPPPKIA